MGQYQTLYGSLPICTPWEIRIIEINIAG